MKDGWVYILECSDGSFYTGSTNNLDYRLTQHKAGDGANYTKKRLPVKLIYFDHFQYVSDAFDREKQLQGWSRAKKLALIKNQNEDLHDLSECKNESHFSNFKKEKTLSSFKLKRNMCP